MALQLIEVTADHGHVDTLVALGEQKNALDVYADERGEMDRCLVRYVIAAHGGRAPPRRIAKMRAVILYGC